MTKKLSLKADEYYYSVEPETKNKNKTGSCDIVDGIRETGN